MNDDARWLEAAASLAARARPLSRPNPAVGAIIVNDGRVVGRGWTGSGGRPHAEAKALVMAGDGAIGATLYVTLEPCAHASLRGPACADLIAASPLAKVVIGCEDPDVRTAGQGLARIRKTGIAADLLSSTAAEESLSGYLMLRSQGRPEVTLKLATSLDGCIALADGESQWITGETARAHGHAIRAKSDAILVGGGTWRSDSPTLNVRVAGLEDRSPERWLLTRGSAPDGWRALALPHAIFDMEDIQYLYIEGGAQTAAAFLSAGLVDRLLLYRAPIVIGGGRPCIGDIGLASLGDAHGQWQSAGRSQLGSDTLEVYRHRPCSQE